MPIARESEPPKRVCLFLFGAFRLQPPAHLPTRKAEALLAYLALHPAAHSREKLAALLWGDSPDDLARGSLRKALTLLRGQLGEDLLLADREAVQVNPACGLWVDALELRSRAAQVLAGSVDSDAGLDLDLYAGDLLADFYDDWILPLREELRDLFVAALLRLAARAYERCDYERAIDLAACLLHHDPANEEAHRTLMLAYAATGRRAAALEQFARCQRSLAQELDVAPDAATMAIYERIKHEQSLAPAPQPVHNLPSPLTSFVGRAELLADLAAALRSARLVTLTGPGGCGKTRTAVQAAQAAAEAYPDGVLWFELTALADPALVAQALTRALALPEMPGLPAGDQAANFLRSRRLLLVMDNCEHLVLACAQLAAALLAACPRLTILATSREALGIAGEAVCPVPPMPLPDPGVVGRLEPAMLMGNESVRLFDERARAVAPHFRLAEQNAAAVCAICRALDGLPLSIELAAARVKVLSPGQIAERLSDRFALLTGGDRLAQPRHQTLRAAIDWSYHLLDEPERALLRGLSVFAGGFTLEAVEATWQERGQPSALELLSRLVDKSLVAVEAAGPGEADATRYRLLETIRAYAAARLAEQGESEAARRRHLAYYCRLAEENEVAWLGPRIKAVAAMVDRELDNFLAALAFGVEHDPITALRAAAAFGLICARVALTLEIRAWLESAIMHIEALPGALADAAVRRAHARCWAALGHMALNGGQNASAARYFARTTELAREAGDGRTVIMALGMWALVELMAGDWEAGGRHGQEALDLARAQQDWAQLPMALSQTGRYWAGVNRGDQARAYAEEAIALAAKTGNLWASAFAHWDMGRIALLQGEPAEASAHLQEAFGIFSDVRDRYGANMVASTLADIARESGDLERARLLYRQVLLEWRDLGSLGAAARCVECLAFLAHAEGCAGAIAVSAAEEPSPIRQAATPGRQPADAQPDGRHLALCLQAVRLLGAASALRGRHAAPLATQEVTEHQAHLAALRTSLGDARFAEALLAAQSFTLDQVINLAMQNL